MPGENNNALENFRPYEDEESTLEELNIEGNHRNLIGKSFNPENCAKKNLSGRIP